MKKLLILFATFPAITSAAQSLQVLTGDFYIIVNYYLIPLAVALAFLAFLFGVLKFAASAGSEEGRKQGYRLIVWGIISLTVMLSVWGIINFIARDLGIGGVPSIPVKVPGD